MAQRGTADLYEKHGVDAVNKTKTIAEMGLTQAQAQTQFNKYWLRWQSEGKTIAAFMQNNFGQAAFLQEFWTGHVHAITSPPAGSGNIFIPPGDAYTVADQLWWPYGKVTGSGLFGDDRYDTCLMPDHARWNGNPAKRNVLVSPCYGRDGVLGYHERCYLNDVRFEGAAASQWYDPSYESSGVVLWDGGEGSLIDRIKSDNFNDFGVCLVRATPAHIHNLSAFINKRAALGLIGTALGTVRVDLISGDDNPWLIEMLPGFGREAGGNVTVGTGKLETSTTQEGAFGPTHTWKGEGAAYCRGQYNLIWGNLTFASPWIKTGQLFYCDDRLTNGSPQNSRIECTGKGFGFGASVVDGMRGRWFDPPADYSAFRLIYEGGKLWINGEEKTPKPYPVGAGPMGFARAGETLNYSTATPQKQITGTITPPPNPVACTTWEVGAWGAWGPCVNGSQTRTRTVTAGPSGCTGTPPGTKPSESESQACTVDPPGGTIATLTNVSVPTVSTNLPVNWPNAKTLAFEGFNSGGTIGGTICVGDGFALKVGGNGSVYLSVTGVGNTQCVPAIPAGTVKAGQAVNFTATLPVARTFTGIGAFAGSGSGEAFTCTKLTVTG